MTDVVTAEQMETLYRTAQGVRSRFDGDAARATEYFHDYVNFVTRSAPARPDATLLDVGCGAGWSSYLFAQHGYWATGVDLNHDAFEPPPTAGLALQEASVLDLPFADASFDVVASYQTLEHVPNPRLALNQMLRVCKPGGVVCVVGPNLVSIWQALKALVLVWRNRPTRRIFLRDPGMPRHPYGNTLPEALAVLPLTLARLVVKSVVPGQHFTMRRPDSAPPFFADNDACYLCNPIDLTKYLARHGCQIIQNGAYGRPLLTASLAGGTWVAARKPDGTMEPGRPQ